MSMVLWANFQNFMLENIRLGKGNFKENRMIVLFNTLHLHGHMLKFLLRLLEGFNLQT